MLDADARGTFRPSSIHIGDFGLRFYEAQEPDQQPFVPGFLPYVAPEIFQKGASGLTSTSDIWAIGCIGYELCTGLRLFPTFGLEVEDIRANEDWGRNYDLSKMPSRFSNRVIWLIRSCLAWEPSARLSAAIFAQHLEDYFVENYGGRLETRQIFSRPQYNPFAVSDHSTAIPVTSNQVIGKRNMNVPAECQSDCVVAELSDACGELGDDRYSGTTLETSSGPGGWTLVSNQSEYLWTTGGDPNLAHVTAIDFGGSGQVHEVRHQLPYHFRNFVDDP